MTVNEAISRIDALKPNEFTKEEKLRWLSILDGMIKEEIIDTHEGDNIGAFTEYSPNDVDRVLLVAAPYDDVYIRWLEAQIDYANGEYGKYNNSMAMYNTAYTTFKNHFNRTHMPVGKKFKFY